MGQFARGAREIGVMPALVAGIHVFSCGRWAKKAWMAGTSPAMIPFIHTLESGE
jgi:hypothetical protein